MHPYRNKRTSKTLWVKLTQDSHISWRQRCALEGFIEIKTLEWF